MLAVRSCSSLASFALTAGLLGLMISTLASRDGLRGQNHNAAIHAFEVATRAEAPDRTVTKRTPARSKQLAQRSALRSAQIAPASPLDAINFRENSSRTKPTIPSLELSAPSDANMLRHVGDPGMAQLVEPSALPASPPRAEASAYSSIVLAWIKRHQRFPESHVRNALDATVLIAFTIDRHGRASHVRVVRGSGLSWLDALAVRQVRGASPFPRPLKSATAETLSFEVPMRYRARG